MRSLEQVNIRTNVRTYVRSYSHTYVRDRPYIPSTTLLCEGIINIKVLLIFHTKFQPNIPSHFGEMDLNVWVDVNFFRVDVNFQMAIVT